MSGDKIEIKDLDTLVTVTGADYIAVQRVSDGILYKATKSNLIGATGLLDLQVPQEQQV